MRATDSQPSRSSAWLTALFAVYVVLAHAPIFRLGFFSDDLFFFDAIRRFPFFEHLIGQHGIYPWYRPLSRELYFLGLTAAGEGARFVADASSLLAVLFSTFALYRIGTHFFRRHVAAGAACLFAASELTRFVASWASTFQDNLAVALMLGAVWMESEGRRRPALACALAAPFAKETGFLVWGLLLAYRVARDGRVPGRMWFVAHGAAAASAVAAHLLVRSLWQTGGSTFRAQASLGDLGASLTATVRSLAPWGHWPSDLDAWLLAAGAGAVAGLILVALTRPEGSRGMTAPAPSRRGVGFALCAAALGAAPLVFGNLMALSAPTTYYAYPAIPGLAMLAALTLSRLPAAIFASLFILWITGNLLGLAYREPDFGKYESWISTDRSTWWEQIRIARATDRLGEDLRTILAERPESVVVLYAGLPVGTFLMLTEDGPPTRELLGDPTARSYYLGQAPADLRPDRMRIVHLDVTAFHLRVVPRTGPGPLSGAVNAILLGSPERALVWCEYGRAETDSFAAIYILAAARLLDEGPEAFWTTLQSSGLADTAEASVAVTAARAAAEGHPLPEEEVARILRTPRSAAVHAAAAESLLAHGVADVAGLEARIAIGLGAQTAREHYIVAEALAAARQVDVAVDELDAAIRLDVRSPSAYGQRARALRQLLVGQRAESLREAERAGRR